MKRMPDVMQYQSYRAYLSDLMQYEKNASRATLASMGKLFGMSAPALQMVLSGERNLSVHKVYRITRLLKLGLLETEYFESLVLHDQAEDPDERAYYEGKLLRLRSGNDVVRLRVADPVLFSRWYVPALMLYLVEISPVDHVSDAELSRIFGLPKDELAQAVSELKNSGLLTVTEQGRFRIQADKMSSSSAQKYFLKSLLIECMRRVDVEFKSQDSFFTSETMTLSLAQFRSYVAEHRTLVEKYMSMTAPLGERAIFQSGFFSFPVTQPQG